ncbi:MAG: ferrous iron transport protein A, partial [Desulfovibrionaceae bacterium]
MQHETNLRNLAVDQAAVITRITAPGELGKRIRDLGLTPATRIQVVGHAPLRDPVALRVQGAVITL